MPGPGGSAGGEGRRALAADGRLADRGGRAGSGAGRGAGRGTDLGAKPGRAAALAGTAGVRSGPGPAALRNATGDLRPGTGGAGAGIVADWPGRERSGRFRQSIRLVAGPVAGGALRRDLALGRL